MKRTDRDETPDSPRNPVNELQFWAEPPITEGGRHKRPTLDSPNNGTSSIRERLISELVLLDEGPLVQLLLEALPEQVNIKYQELILQNETQGNDYGLKPSIPTHNKHSKIAKVVGKIAYEQLALLEEKLQAYKQPRRTTI